MNTHCKLYTVYRCCKLYSMNEHYKLYTVYTCCKLLRSFYSKTVAVYSVHMQQIGHSVHNAHYGLFVGHQKLYMVYTCCKLDTVYTHCKLWSFCRETKVYTCFKLYTVHCKLYTMYTLQTVQCTHIANCTLCTHTANCLCAVEAE